MYVFYDSQGIVQSIAVASEPIEGYTSPFIGPHFLGLTELFLDDTEYADVAQEPLMYKITNSVPVKQTQPFTLAASKPTTETRLLAIEAAIADLMGV